MPGVLCWENINKVWSQATAGVVRCRRRMSGAEILEQNRIWLSWWLSLESICLGMIWILAMGHFISWGRPMMEDDEADDRMRSLSESICKWRSEVGETKRPISTYMNKGDTWKVKAMKSITSDKVPNWNNQWMISMISSTKWESLTYHIRGLMITLSSSRAGNHHITIGLT